MTTTGVKFQNRPFTRYGSTGVVAKRSTVQFISISNNWAKVSYKGETGHIHTAYIEFKTNLTLGNEIQYRFYM